MLKIAAVLVVLTAAWGADDPWQKAKQLAIGSDIRIYKLGSTEPVSGKMAGVGEGKVQLIVKKDQIASSLAPSGEALSDTAIEVAVHRLRRRRLGKSVVRPSGRLAMPPIW